MEKLDLLNLEEWHRVNYQDKLKGRWITLDHIYPLIKNLSRFFKVKKIGRSELNQDIFSITFGEGKTNILIWTQMHGNECTGTKAVFDLFQFFEEEGDHSEVSKAILKKCKITVIPIINPDGAQKYTRVNANNIDLNRDVIDKKAAESRILMDVLNKTKPEYCFNMHDQRTIFSVTKENNPASISFLAPSIDKKRTITDGRKETMKVIVEMNNLLQKFIPDQVGRYSDEFYPTATGDNFQKMGHNTILIESGHFKNDYHREITRKYTFLALLQGIYAAVQPKEGIEFESYFDIPNNEKRYLDIIVKNIVYKGRQVDVGVLFKERLVKDRIHFVPTIETMEDLSLYNTNKMEILKKQKVFNNEKELNNWLENEYFKTI